MISEIFFANLMISIEIVADVVVWGVGRFGTQQYLMAWSYFQPKYELFILTKGAILRKVI